MLRNHPKLAAILFGVAAQSLLAADPSMTPQERSQIIQLMKDSEKEVLQAVRDLTDEQWQWKPAPERWSAGDVAEHMVLSAGPLVAQPGVSLRVGMGAAGKS